MKKLTDDERLAIALGTTEPRPWPESIDEEIALAERNLADPIRDHAPRTAPAGRTRGVLSILDRLDRENHSRRFQD